MMSDDETREACKRVDLLTIEAGAIASGDKELLNHIHYLMDWIQKHTEVI